MINKVVLVGRITKSPELKMTQSNIPFVNFTIAVNRPFKDDKGETQADFIQSIVWRRQAENTARFVKKGDLIGVEGRIQTRNYEDDNGRTIYITEVVCDSIVFLESKGDNDNHPQTDEEIDETYKDNPYNPTITTPTSRRAEREEEFKSNVEVDTEGLPF
jgi:single-strand DNA-binding protein